MPLLLLAILFASSYSLFADVGKGLYEQKCSQCHGPEGRGDGTASPFINPKPRDFTLGTYKIRTTPSGVLPTDEDLIKTVSQGIPGTSMPAFEKALSKNEILEVVNYLKTFFFKFHDAKPEAIKIGSPPRKSKEIVDKGKEVYNKFRCFECHGSAGRADGPSSPTLKDEKGNPSIPADLTKPWTFRGGGEVKDIFTRLTTGLSGTPMPSFVGVFPDPKEDEHARWALAHYIKSLSELHPNFKSIINAQYFSGNIPLSFDGAPSSPWAGTEEIDIPLVGQVIQEPRLFMPAIDMITVSALYNEGEIVMQIRWNDRTNNSIVSQDKKIFPDSLSVQFPVEESSSSELPYFLGGSERQPVQTLTWSSNFDKIHKKIYKGLNSFEDAPTAVEGKASFDQGQWTLFLRTPLSLDGQFKAGEFVPVAFSAGDGSYEETGARRSISAWVHLILKEQPSKMRFAWPSLVFAGTLGGEILLLKWMRKRGNRLA